MKILYVHNTYQQAGGEDNVLEVETRLVKAYGHTVVLYQRQNDDLKKRSALGMIGAGVDTVWSSQSFRDIQKLIATEKPDVAHFHNTFPLISPAGYYACAAHAIPVVQTLHNYRLLCPAATFRRDGRVCEDCLARSITWPAVMYGCYRGDRLATSAVSAMLATHRALATWRRKVDLYIALSEFARRKFITGGLPADRIVVKPNFVHADAGTKQGEGDYALYVGRLSEEKGVHLLLAAWSRLGKEIPLRIAGDGPMREQLAQQIRLGSLDGVQLLGRVGSAEITQLLAGARFLVLPSLWYEGFPLVIVEAFAAGTPVIASRLGAMEEIVQDGKSGLHFSAGDASDLASKVRWAWEHPGDVAEMGREARRQFEGKYCAEQNYRSLLAIYQRVIRERAQRLETRMGAYSALQGTSTKRKKDA